MSHQVRKASYGFGDHKLCCANFHTLRRRRKADQRRRGYVGDELATQNTFSGNWLKTRDIMTMDEKKNFYVTDRLKEVSDLTTSL